MVFSEEVYGYTGGGEVGAGGDLCYTLGTYGYHHCTVIRSTGREGV
jgi:hypothetical protein